MPAVRMGVICKRGEGSQCELCSSGFVEYAIMVLHVPGCLGHYDFDQIADFAKKRFVEGIDTVSLMNQAGSQREKEEIALVCMLDIDIDQIRDIKLSCRYARECKIVDCRERLIKMIGEDLAVQ
jgi:hypothetical protein